MRFAKLKKKENEDSLKIEGRVAGELKIQNGQSAAEEDKDDELAPEKKSLYVFSV
jgi:hypothetical protein